MAMYLRPHSEEWFQAMECSDAKQAYSIKAAIEQYGSPEICSVCGDSQASDYKMVDANLPKYAVATLRLCEHCHYIRRNSGDNYTPFP